MQHFLENADLEYLGKIETLTKQYFGVATFQTMKFFMIEMYAAIPNSQEYKQWSDVVSEYLVWQSEYVPYNLLLNVKGYQHSHDNDLSWNQCEKVCLTYRKTISPDTYIFKPRWEGDIPLNLMSEEERNKKEEEWNKNATVATDEQLVILKEFGLLDEE